MLLFATGYMFCFPSYLFAVGKIRTRMVLWRQYISRIRGLFAGWCGCFHNAREVQILFHIRNNKTSWFRRTILTGLKIEQYYFKTDVVSIIISLIYFIQLFGAVFSVVVLFMVLKSGLFVIIFNWQLWKPVNIFVRFLKTLVLNFSDDVSYFSKLIYSFPYVGRYLLLFTKVPTYVLNIFQVTICCIPPVKFVLFFFYFYLFTFAFPRTYPEIIYSLNCVSTSMVLYENGLCLIWVSIYYYTNLFEQVGTLSDLYAI